LKHGKFTYSISLHIPECVAEGPSTGFGRANGDHFIESIGGANLFRGADGESLALGGGLHGLEVDADLADGLEDGAGGGATAPPVSGLGPARSPATKRLYRSATVLL